MDDFRSGDRQPEREKPVRDVSALAFVLIGISAISLTIFFIWSFTTV